MDIPPIVHVLLVVGALGATLGFAVWLWGFLKARCARFGLGVFGAHFWIAVFGTACLFVAVGLQNDPASWWWCVAMGGGALVGAAALIFYRSRDPVLALLYPVAAGCFSLVLVVMWGFWSKRAQHEHQVARDEETRQRVRRFQSS